jgi:hypothetical protein
MKLRPAGRLGLALLDRLPVVAPRGEHVDHDGAVRACPDLVRHVRGDAPRPAWAEAQLLVAHAELDLALQDHPELLVLVRVLRDVAIGIELHDAEGRALAVHGADGDAVPDPPRADLVEIVEGAHADEPNNEPPNNEPPNNDPGAMDATIRIERVFQPFPLHENAAW